MRYLAIDFETANSQRSSICAFGYALFEDGQILEAGVELCRPVPNYYDIWNTRIHGIRFEDTRHLGGFEDHLLKIDRFSPEFIVAHNASFDISCLRKWCDQQGKRYPSYPYFCTVVMSRTLYPGLSHSLDSMCELHDIQLNHHEAGSDALACGLLLQKGLARTGANSLADLCQALNIAQGRLTATEYSSCGIGKSSRPARNKGPGCKPGRE